MLKARIRTSLCCWCAPVPVQTLPLLFCLLFISQHGKENKKKSQFATSSASALQLHLQKFSGSQRTMDASPSGVCSSNFPARENIALFADNTCCLKPSRHHDSIVTPTQFRINDIVASLLFRNVYFIVKMPQTLL